MTDSADNNVEFVYRGIPVTLRVSSTEDHIGKLLLERGRFYEQPMLEAIANYLMADDLVIDVGANIGNHTVFFSKVCGCRVIAFEPLQQAYEILCANVQMNGLSARVTTHMVALGPVEGAASIIAFDANNLGGTTLTMGDEGDIPVRTLDSFAISEPIRLIKIDAEGMDQAVLEGARDMLDARRPWVLCEAATTELFEEIAGYLRLLDYMPLAVYNATDTYLFLPTRTQKERDVFVRTTLDGFLSLQRKLGKLESRIAAVKRQYAKSDLHIRNLGIRLRRLTQVQDQKQEILELGKLLADATSRFHETKAALVDAQREIEALKQTQKQAQKEALEIEESLAYRLGMVLLKARTSLFLSLRLPADIWRLRRKHEDQRSPHAERSRSRPPTSGEDEL